MHSNDFVPVIFPPVAVQPKVTEEEFLQSEKFHSLQGEGDDIGKRVVFFRSPLCNFRCDFCDTANFVSGVGTTVISFKELANYLTQECRVSKVIWTGGEPTIFIDKIASFEQYLQENAMYVPEFAFETNGSIFKPFMEEKTDWLFTVSPKLGVSSMSPKLNYDALKSFVQLHKDGGSVQFKFVVNRFDELAAISDLLEQTKVPTIHDKRFDVILQPEWYQFEKYGTEFHKPYWMFIKDLTEHLLQDEYWKRYNWRVLPQMHKLLWGNIAGV